MIRLLNIELKKILRYRVFWILTGLYFLFLGLGILMSEFMMNSWVDGANSHLPIPLPHITLYFFPDIWQNVLFFASIRYFLLFPAIIVIILITNEFTFRTVRQNIINGMSRREFVISKLQVIFYLSVVITLVLAVMIFFIGMSNTASPSLKMIFSRILFVPAFFLQVFTFLVFAFFTAFLLRSTGLAIGVFTLYTLIIEPVIYYSLKLPRVPHNHISPRLPVNSVLKVIEYPNLPQLQKLMGMRLQESVSLIDCAVPLIYAAVMIWVVFRIMNRKDI
jgi:ABC-2 type transport system permease protein